MLPLSWRHSICRLATILLRIFHKRTGIPGKTQHSFKATSSDSPNLRRDLTQPLLKSGFFCYQTVEVGKIDFLLSGEFSETKFVNCPECFGDDECETCDGSGRIEITVPVTWTTIKEIWAKGVEHFSATAQENN